MTEPSGVWLYAVTDHVSDVPDVPGIYGSPVRAIEERGLGAVVSDVDLDEFSESRLHDRLDDMQWLEAAAKAHHRVIDELATIHRVVPMRLATVFTGEQSVRAMLIQRGPELRELLGWIGDRIELGVKAFAAQSEPEQSRAAESDSESPASSGSGLAYLQRRRDELAASKTARQDAARTAREVHRALAQLAVDSRLHPPQVHELAGTKAPMLLNAAYLVQDGEQDQFSETVELLAEQYRAIRLHLTGPWPPYSFAGLDEGEADRR